jgi:hypothetical protein
MSQGLTVGRTGGFEGMVCVSRMLCARIAGPELGGEIGPITRARMSRCDSQTRAPPVVGRCGDYGRGEPGEVGGRGDGGWLSGGVRVSHAW